MAVVQNASTDGSAEAAADKTSMSPLAFTPAPISADVKDDRDSGPAPSPRRPANDDARIAGDMLRSLQFRPSLWPYLLALIASAIYGGTLFGVAGFDARVLEADPDALLKAAISACPFVLFFLLAGFAREVQRVRHSADAMSRVAVRLVTPATSAQDEIVSLSQTVRMEVASLGDGLERGVLRIGDLELVASDLLRRLEQAYASADAKMHTLTRRLSSERESLEAYAERVGDTILNSRRQIDLDLKMASEQIALRVRETSVGIMSNVEDHAKGAIRDAEQALEAKAKEVSRLLESYSSSIRAATEQANIEADAIREKLVAQSAASIKAMNDVLLASQHQFATTQEKVTETFTSRSKDMAAALETSEQNFTKNAEALSNHLRTLEGPTLARIIETAQEIKKSGESLNGALDGFEGKVSELSLGAVSNIDALVTKVQTEFETQIASADAQAERNISILSTTLTSGIEGVNKALLDGLREFSAVLGDAKTGEEVQAAAAELRGALQASLDEFRTEFGGVCDALSDVFVGNSDRVSESVIRASEVTVARVQDAGNRLAAAVEDTGALVISDLSALNTDILKKIEDTSAISAKAVHDAARQPLADIHRDSQRAKEEAINSLKKLSELNAVIRSTIAAAEKRIGFVSGSLVNQTEIFLKLVEGSRINPGKDAPVAPLQTRPPQAPSLDMSRILRSVEEAAAVHRSEPSHLERLGETIPEPIAVTTRPTVEASEADGVDSLPLPDRDSPGWMSRLLARASRSDEQPQTIAMPGDAADIVYVDALSSALTAFADGEDVVLGEEIYQSAGVSIFRRIQARYAEPSFRASADKLAHGFQEALRDYLVAGADQSDWSAFIDDHLAGLITAHATGRIFAKPV